MPLLSTTLLTAVKLAVQNPLAHSCKTDGICLWWEKVCWEKALQMLPKGHQTLLFLREMQTAFITNRPRSCWFFTGAGVSFALPVTKKRKRKRKKICCLGSRTCRISSLVPLWASPAEVKKLDDLVFIDQRVERKWNIVHLCYSVEAQPVPESCLKDVNCNSSWLLTVISCHKPTQHQREKDQQENDSLSVHVATVLALGLIRPLCVLPTQDLGLLEWMEKGKYDTLLLSWCMPLKFLINMPFKAGS